MMETTIFTILIISLCLFRIIVFGVFFYCYKKKEKIVDPEAQYVEFHMNRNKIRREDYDYVTSWMWYHV